MASHMATDAEVFVPDFDIYKNRDFERRKQVSFLGDAESSLGDAASSLGDAKSFLGDAKSSLG